MTETASGIEVWTKLQTTDPKFVKPITGRQYSGSSPNPTYIAKRLTEVFGPATQGWGTQIIEESYREFLTPEDGDYALLHTVRLRLWTSHPTQYVEQCGTTKIAYRTSKGKLMVDDDGPKKSVTDAFTKCASLLGAAADIFLGRWDDAKYQADLQAEFGKTEPAFPGEPPAPRGQNAAAAAEPKADAPW